MRITVITPDRNLRDNDFEGAFDIEAKRFITYRESLGDICNRISLSYDTVITTFQKTINIPTDWLVFFCHGTDKWLFRAKFNIDTVNYEIVDAKNVTAYSCSAANGIFSPVYHLSLSNNVNWADGHLNAGHTTSNPNICRWIKGKAQIYSKLINPNFSQFAKKLNDRHENNVRFDYPLLSLDQLTNWGKLDAE